MVQFNYPEIQDSRQQTCSPMLATQRQKQPTGMLPGIITQCDADSLTSLRRLAEALPNLWDGKASLATGEEEDEVPYFGENFDEASKNEANWVESTSEEK